MNKQELKDTVAQLKNYKVVEVDFLVNTFTTENGCVYAFDLTKTGLLKTKSIKFLWTVSNFESASY